MLFGMRDRGRSFSFNILPMDISQQGNNYVYSLPSNIRQYPYGLSGIGLLVDNGQGRGRPNEGDNSPFLGRTSRTAIAWSNDRMHFFLIVATNNQGWTWDNTVNFFTQELPRWMRENLPIWMRTFRQQLINDRVITQREAPVFFPDHPVNIQISYAIMLDGGGSSQIAWEWRRRNGRRAVRFHQEIRDGQPRQVPTFVEVNANAP
jgi:hypothetical protein